MKTKLSGMTLLFALAASCVLAACSSADGHGDVVQAGRMPDLDGRLFTLLPSGATGVRFENRLRDTRDLNVFTYRNYYNGGGVAIGDLTGDGLPEIVLTANHGGPRLYVNEGGFRFRDATRAAGLKSETDSWTTGVALADVNGDGLLDIYISKAGPVAPDRRRNELWIHQGVNSDGVPTFREMAAAYGVADDGYSTHAAFLDYDRDGDLDLFLINNSPRPITNSDIRNTRDVRDPYSGAKLFRNDGNRFKDVSAAAGIHSPENAFALGIAVGDVNRDGWPDVYVANDFFERDYLYINKGDGTFAESADRQMPVHSYFSMGLDIADVDNDQWPDVYTTDMLPEDEYRLKTTSTFESLAVYQAKLRNGYHHQLMRNMLQRNNRDGTFSDVGELAGVARTDWSWSALIADLDLDGYKDIFVTNGLAKDVTSQDYVAFLGNEETMKAVTGGGRTRADFEQLTSAMTSTPIPNYAFRNDRGLRFRNEAASWGLDTPSFSNGAAYGDLDGDGALDLVVNNVNQEAFVYRNNARTMHAENRFLRVRLEGEGANRFAIGARVTLHAGMGEGNRESGVERRGETFMQEMAPARGFQSTVDYVLVFGIGRREIDSVHVEWPDGRVSVLTDVAANQTITARQGEGRAVPPTAPIPEARFPIRRLLTDVTSSAALEYIHRENDFIDFDREKLIPKMLSTEGPPMAVADVNGDGLEDVFIGGAKDQPGKLLLQRRAGGRVEFAGSSEQVFERDRTSEDVGAVFFDANGDGHPDLYVVSGGNEFSDLSSALQDRLYLNDGRGVFRKAEAGRHLPAASVSGSRPAAADYDGDGDVDIFVGGRVVPWRYGTDPRSMLLRNDGRGHFTDVTEQVAPGLARVGMVTDAIWRDVDGDGRLDLVVVGEWMPITIFRNTGSGTLERLDVPGLEKSHGWWNRIVAGDFTGDGRVDFVVGNLGLNSRLRATDTEPVTMYVKDFDGNGFVEQVLTAYNNGVSYPLSLRDDLIRALPFLSTRLPSHKDYALKTIADIFTPKELGDAVVKKAHTFATTVVRNNGDGSFTLVPLPLEAQIAPVYGLLVKDFDGDRKADLMLAGNFDGFKPDIGPLRASYGLVLRGDGKGNFSPMRAAESGFSVPGQARDIQIIDTRSGALYVVTRNNDRPLVFRATDK